MKNFFVCESIRLMRFLYSLGFDKESFYENGKEYWRFYQSNELQESLDFYFCMRKKTNQTGVNDNEKSNYTDNRKQHQRRI